MHAGKGLSFLLISWNSGLIFQNDKNIAATLRTYEIEFAANNEKCLNKTFVSMKGSEEIQV